MRIISTSLLAACALALGAVCANAQDYRDNDRARYMNSADENVEVTTPPYGPQRDRMGTPYKNVSLSKEVRFDDLDLRTNRGAHVLKTRIRLTARMLCKDLDERYPVTADNSPPCYRDALEDAMYQANRAIDDARSYND